MGDLNYKYYCEMGRQMNKKLSQLGAKSLYPFGEGSNDQGRIDEAFEEWSIPVWNALYTSLPSLSAAEAAQIQATCDPTAYSVVADNSRSVLDFESSDANIQTTVF